MDIVHVVLMLIFIGVLLWLIQAYIPIAEPIKTIITVVIIVAVCLWLLQLSGLLNSGLYIGKHSG